MELVYLWVEKYKNIEKQGFNFSPRFECEFFPEYEKDNYDQNALTEKSIFKIKPKKDIENFFSTNINITAIVGENGSGKSSVMGNIAMQNANFIIYENSDTLFLYTPDSEYVKNVIFNQIEKVSEINFDFFALDYDILMPNLTDEYIELDIISGTTSINIINSIVSIDNRNIDLYAYKSIVNRLLIQYSNSSTIFNYNPSVITLQKNYEYIHNKLKYDISELEGKILLSEFSNEPTNAYLYLYQLFNDFLNDDEFMLLLYLFLQIYSNNPLVLDLLDELFDDPELTFVDLKEQIFDSIPNHINDLKILRDNFDEYVAILKKENFFHIQLSLSDLKKSSEINLNLLSNSYIFNIIEIDFYSQNYIKIHELSQGERYIYINMLMIYDKIMNTEKDNILIFLDEPDLTLHPQWQKNYINELINLLSQIKNKKFQIVVSTHSPFLISDLPKENVVFLKNGKQVYPFENKQTFGANIHTLLSDGFFMSDGLMGEFAKNKINEIISFHKEIIELQEKEDSQELEAYKCVYEDKQKDFWHIQSIIGEEYLKQVVKNHLVEIDKILLGEDKAKEAEIQRLEDQINALKGNQ